MKSNSLIVDKYFSGDIILRFVLIVGYLKFEFDQPLSTVESGTGKFLPPSHASPAVSGRMAGLINFSIITVHARFRDRLKRVSEANFASCCAAINK